MLDRRTLEKLAIQDNGIPIYVQLRDQLAALIGRRLLAPGARLPTMRQVAVELRIDLNTVQRAYGELAEAGLVTLVQGRGTFVAAAPPPISPPDAATLAAKVAAEARAQGIALTDLIQSLKSFKHS